MPRRSKPGLPKLPQLLEQKLSKTGQTRGADDDVIFQNSIAYFFIHSIYSESFEKLVSPIMLRFLVE